LKDLITQKSSSSLIPVLPVFLSRIWLQHGGMGVVGRPPAYPKLRPIQSLVD